METAMLTGSAWYHWRRIIGIVFFDQFDLPTEDWTKHVLLDDLLEGFSQMAHKIMCLGNGESFSDRLNSRYTSLILIVLELLISTKYFIYTPISCWCPSTFTVSHVAYVNKVCWTTNTYYIPFEHKDIPENSLQPGSPAEVTYYQWVALILICQALFFYLPRPIWGFFNKKCGVPVSTITEAAIWCLRPVEGDGRDKSIRYLVKHVMRFLHELHKSETLSMRMCGGGALRIFYESYLVLVYLTVKLLYIGNLFLQVFLLNTFLGTDYHAYGLDVLTKFASGEPWQESYRFPRVTLCTFQIRTLGNIHDYTVQCSLPMNLLNEIIFTFLWFWFIFVALATLGSFFTWAINCLSLSRRVSYVKIRLIAMDQLDKHNESNVVDFVRVYLKTDGFFVVMMVAKNSLDSIAAELLCGLWAHYKDRHKLRDRPNTEVYRDNLYEP